VRYSIRSQTFQLSTIRSHLGLAEQHLSVKAPTHGDLVGVTSAGV
jgi:hypothetical protein